MNGSKTKGLLILALILLSLLPAHLIFQYLKKKVAPKRSGGRFLLFLLLALALVFGYTFMLVLLIRLVFPGA